MSYIVSISPVLLCLCSPRDARQKPRLEYYTCDEVRQQSRHHSKTFETMAEHVKQLTVNAKPTTTSLLALVVVCGVVLYVSYRRLLPKPIPGIPYNKSATSSLFGDVPEMMKYISRTQEIFPWITEQTRKHQSPIVQVFGRPFSKPWVVISEHRESQDSMFAIHSMTAEPSKSLNVCSYHKSRRLIGIHSSPTTYERIRSRGLRCRHLHRIDSRLPHKLQVH